MSDPVALATFRNSLSVFLRTLTPEQAEAFLELAGPEPTVADLRRLFGEEEPTAERLEALISGSQNTPGPAN